METMRISKSSIFIKILISITAINGTIDNMELVTSYRFLFCRKGHVNSITFRSLSQIKLDWQQICSHGNQIRGIKKNIFPANELNWYESSSQPCDEWAIGIEKKSIEEKVASKHPSLSWLDFWIISLTLFTTRSLIQSKTYWRQQQPSDFFFVFYDMISLRKRVYQKRN